VLYLLIACEQDRFISIFRKVFTMRKILGFFQKELSICNEEKAKIDNEIHRANLDVEFVRKTIDKIVSESDCTYDVFYANGNDMTFVTREISSLKLKEEDLANFISSKSDQLAILQNRINSITEMINECHKIDYKESSITPGVNIIQIQEAERQRIARDIHDSVVQKLAALIHKSEFAMRVIDSDSLRAKLELDIINQVVRECIAELREIISNLRPMSLDDLGFEIALRRNIAQINSVTDMQIILKYNITDDVEIEPIISVTVLRIIQELCSNAIKYSQGSKISIEISALDNRLSISFEDDGVGFLGFNDSSPLNNNKSGFGLPILKERVKQLDGYINAGKSKNNTGMRYDIEIPIENKEK